MKNLDTYITEKILINKNTKIQNDIEMKFDEFISILKTKFKFSDKSINHFIQKLNTLYWPIKIDHKNPTVILYDKNIRLKFPEDLIPDALDNICIDNYIDDVNKRLTKNELISSVVNVDYNMFCIRYILHKGVMVSIFFIINNKMNKVDSTYIMVVTKD